MLKMTKKITTVFMMMGILLASQSAFAMRQTSMERAIRALDNAERMLRRGSEKPDKHQKRALRHIQKAQKELRKAIESANSRHGGGKYKNKHNDDNHGRRGHDKDHDHDRDHDRNHSDSHRDDHNHSHDDDRVRKEKADTHSHQSDEDVKVIQKYTPGKYPEREPTIEVIQKRY